MAYTATIPNRNQWRVTLIALQRGRGFEVLRYSLPLLFRGGGWGVVS